MKKLFWSLIILLVMAACASAQTPKPTPFSLYAGGAVTMPNSPDAFNENYKTGYHFFGGVGMKAMPMMQLIGKAEYTTMGYDFGSESGIDGGSAKIWMFGADSRFSFGAPTMPFKPFIFGGGGMASVSIDGFSGSNTSLVTAYNDASSTETQNKFYWNVGGGLEFKANPMMSFFVQGRFVSVATDGDATVMIPISLGLKFF